MTAYMLRRLLYVVPVLFGVSLIVFTTTKLVPGDPVSAMAGGHVTPETRELLTQRYALDQSIVVQYLMWLRQAVVGDLGESIASHDAVAGVVGSALGNSLILVGLAAGIAVVAGAALGAIVAFACKGAVRASASSVALMSVSVPQYSLGVLLVVVFAVELGWFPTGGMSDVLQPDSIGALLHHAALPAVAAAGVAAGIIARVFAAALSDEQQQPYIENLQGRGLGEWRIRRHTIRASLAPLITTSGLQIGYMLGGVVYVEVIFAWPGIGQLIYESIAKRDYPVIQAGVLVIAVLFVLINLAVDLSRPILDRRIWSAAGN